MKTTLTAIVDAVLGHAAFIEGPNVRVQVCEIVEAPQPQDKTVEENTKLFFVNGVCFFRTMSVKRFYAVRVVDGLINTEEFSSAGVREFMCA